MATTHTTSRVADGIPSLSRSTAGTITDRDTPRPSPKLVAAPAIASDQSDTLKANGETQPPSASPLPPLAAAYVLLVVENVLRVLQPLALGLAINDLLSRSYQGLLILVGQHLAHMFVASLRQMCFARRLSRFVESEAIQMTSANQSDRDPSQRAARLRERLACLEHSLPETVHIAASLVGALLMLAWYDWTLVPLCLVLIVPAALLNAASARKTLLLGRKLRVAEDQEAEILSSGHSHTIHQHFHSLTRNRLHLAEAQTSNFCLMELFILGVLATALVHYCLNTTAPAGDIFAVIQYVLIFISGLCGVPLMVRHLVKFRAAQR